LHGNLEVGGETTQQVEIDISQQREIREKQRAGDGDKMIAMIESGAYNPKMGRKKTNTPREMRKSTRC